MKEVDRRRFTAMLASEKKVVPGRKHRRVAESYVCLMQLIALGRFNHEILENPRMVNVFVKKLQDAGVEFPSVNEWWISSTQRRILSVIQSGVTDKTEIIQEVGLDMGLGTLAEHLRVIRGSGVELPSIKQTSRRKLFQANSIEVGRRSGNV